MCHYDPLGGGYLSLGALCCAYIEDMVSSFVSQTGVWINCKSFKGNQPKKLGAGKIDL